MAHGVFTGGWAANEEIEMTKHVANAAHELATAPMVLYGHPGSGCTQKVLAMLAEKGAGAEIVLIDMSTGQHKQDEHLARHPFGVIPALQIDGFIMYESRAIARYLDDRLPGASFIPAGGKARALMEQWLSVEYSYLTPGQSKIFMNRVVYPMTGAPVDEAAIATGIAQVRQVFAVLEQHLADNIYLAGDSYSLADMTYLPALFALQISGAGDLIAEFPNVAEWADLITNRPAWKKVLGMIPRW
jgi:glutathione S-transferase